MLSLRNAAVILKNAYNSLTWYTWCIAVMCNTKADIVHFCFFYIFGLIDCSKGLEINDPLKMCFQITSWLYIEI